MFVAVNFAHRLAGASAQLRRIILQACGPFNQSTANPGELNLKMLCATNKRARTACWPYERACSRQLQVRKPRPERLKQHIEIEHKPALVIAEELSVKRITKVAVNIERIEMVRQVEPAQRHPQTILRG